MVTSLRIGSGRQLPPLLFLTNSEALAAQVGVDARDIAMSMVLNAAAAVIDTRSRQPSEIAQEINDSVQQHPACEGVVIVGGHDVIPHDFVDVVAGTRYQTLAMRDGDRPLEDDEFVVWNDDIYGCLDERKRVCDEIVLPALPVSRVPDAGSDALLLNALEARRATHARDFAGIRRAVAGEYAAKVHHATFGTWIDWLKDWFRSSPMATSEPVSSSKPADIAADALYLVLHGDKTDPALYGESLKTHLLIEAVKPSCLERDIVPNVTFAAACWSGLIVNASADTAFSDTDILQKSADESIALSLLARGTSAVIGSTGVHYSPPLGMTTVAAAPFHIAFWRAYRAGIAPAPALHEAKRTYAARWPHRRDSELEQALELKTLAAFCCLGLGW